MQEFFFGQNLKLSVSFLNVGSKNIFPFFIEGDMVTERSRVFQAILSASADSGFVHVQDEREFRDRELMTENFHAPGVATTHLMIPIYLVRKARFVRERADGALSESTGLES
jgi:hypothetical protein